MGRDRGGGALFWLILQSPQIYTSAPGRSGTPSIIVRTDCANLGHVTVRLALTERGSRQSRIVLALWLYATSSIPPFSGAPIRFCMLTLNGPDAGREVVCTSPHPIRWPFSGAVNLYVTRTQMGQRCPP